MKTGLGLLTKCNIENRDEHLYDQTFKYGSRTTNILCAGLTQPAMIDFNIYYRQQGKVMFSEVSVCSRGGQTETPWTGTPLRQWTQSSLVG